MLVTSQVRSILLGMLEMRYIHWVTGSRCRQFSHINPSITTSSRYSRGMSDYSEDLGPILDKLQPLLENLPNQLPLKPNTGPDASHYRLRIVDLLQTRG